VGVAIVGAAIMLVTPYVECRAQSNSQIVKDGSALSIREKVEGGVHVVAMQSPDT